MSHFARVSRFGVFLVVGAAGVHAQQAIQPRVGGPLNGLTAAQLDRFFLGKEAFNHIQTDAEGAGPVMNVYGFSGRCLGCHSSPISGGGSAKHVTRFGVAANGAIPFDPLTALGGPMLQKTSLDILCFEAIPPQADVISQRITPPLFGSGLVEAILDADIQVREIFPPPNVSGRVHIVTPVETPLGPARVGRFGWKSQVATLLTFAGDASVNELGISNRLFPLDNAPNGLPTASQPCDNVLDPEDGPDALGFHKIDRMNDFMRFLAPPPQTPKSGMSGEPLFVSVGCASCHVSTPYVTSPLVTESALANKLVRPFSDFLLHDMGSLGDGIPDGSAAENEFRTPPLWGLRARAQSGLLHDARAQGSTLEGNVHLAITSHDGEANASKGAYLTLSAGDQLKIQKFLLSLGAAEFDFDENGHANMIEETDWFFMRFEVTGPGSFFDADDSRAIGDIDQDGDIDLRDLAGFQRAYTGTISPF